MIYPPQLPPVNSVKFIPPKTSLIKIANDGGHGTISKDNVTIKITDITENTDSRFSTDIEDLNGTKYLVSVSPYMLSLNIDNNTDHILTLTRTVIKIEDNNQQDFPLINSLNESKSDLLKQVLSSYDAYLADILSSYKQVMYGDYTVKHAAFAQELLQSSKMTTGERMGMAFLSGMAHEKMPEISSVRTSDMPEGRILTAYGLKSKILETSPESIYKRYETTLTQKVNILKDKAMKNINDQIQINANNIITNGFYQPISLLPHRSTTIVAPFTCMKTTSNSLNTLVVSIFDLPTQVNQAGDPTKRENFVFKMKAVE